MNIKYFCSQLGVNEIADLNEMGTIPTQPTVWIEMDGARIGWYPFALFGVPDYHDNLLRLDEPQFQVIVNGIIVSPGKKTMIQNCPAHKGVILKKVEGMFVEFGWLFVEEEDYLQYKEALGS